MDSLRTSLTHTQAPRGLTVMELVVIFSIIVFVMMIVLTGQGGFDRSLTITDAAYTIALSVRQAQTFGLSSRTASTSLSIGITNAAYGVHFASSTPPRTYTLFTDRSPTAGNLAVNTLSGYCPGHTIAAGNPDAKPGNCLFDGTSETIQNYTLSRGFTIAKFCGTNRTDGVVHCALSRTGAEVLDIDAMDVSFLRPNTNTVILGKMIGGGYYSFSDATIVIQDKTATYKRAVCVNQYGEIHVSTSTCP